MSNATMRRNLKTRIAVCAILALFSMRVWSKAQNQTLTVDVNLVLVNTTVSDICRAVLSPASTGRISG